MITPAPKKAVRKSFEMFNELEGFDGTWTNRGRMLLLRVLTEQKKFDEAKRYLADALRSAEKMYGHTIWWANAKVLEARLGGCHGRSDHGPGSLPRICLRRSSGGVLLFLWAVL